MRKRGRPSEKFKIMLFRLENPDASKAQCRRMTGLDYKTIRKWWDVIEQNTPVSFSSKSIIQNHKEVEIMSYFFEVEQYDIEEFTFTLSEKLEYFMKQKLHRLYIENGPEKFLNIVDECNNNETSALDFSDDEYNEWDSMILRLLKYHILNDLNKTLGGLKIEKEKATIDLIHKAAYQIDNYDLGVVKICDSLDKISNALDTDGKVININLSNNEDEK